VNTEVRKKLFFTESKKGERKRNVNDKGWGGGEMENRKIKGKKKLPLV